MSSKESATLRQAEKILGNDFLGPDAVNKITGVRIEQVPPLVFKNGEPISPWHLEQASENGAQLILNVHRFADGTPASVNGFQERVTTFKNGKPMWWNPKGWFAQEAFAKHAPSDPYWRISTLGVLPHSKGIHYLEQDQVLATHLAAQGNLSEESHLAIAELAAKRVGIAEMIIADWQKATKALIALAINSFRTKTREDVHDIVANDAAGNGMLLKDAYNLTSDRDSGGYLVGVGASDGGGARVLRFDPRGSYSFIGARFSRS